MANSLACPKCRTKLFAPPDVYGQPVRCTKCETTFTASVSHSPYLEDLPPLPKDNRTKLMAAAVASCLLLATSIILGVNWLSDDSRDNTGMVGSRAAAKAFDNQRPILGPMLTSKGEPIIIPEDDGPDRAPPPGVGDPLGPKKGTTAPPAKRAASGHDVHLAEVSWAVSPGIRQIRISYEFQNGTSPSGGNYSWRLRIDGQEYNAIPIDVAMPLKGEAPFTLPATLSEKPGQLPKVEVWVERSIGSGTGTTASNLVSTK